MLDSILELFERDKKTKGSTPGKKRSFIDRVSAMVEGDEYESRPRSDRRSHEYHDDDDDDRGTIDSDQSGKPSEKRKPTKRERMGDLLEFD